MNCNTNKQAEILKKKYNNLHTSDEVKKVHKRMEKNVAHTIPQKPSLMIYNYMQRMNEILDISDNKVKNKVMNVVKQKLYKKHVFDISYLVKNDIDKNQAMFRYILSLYSLEPDDITKEKCAMVIRKNQVFSLNQWIHFLDLQETKQYSIEIKYWILRSILACSSFDKNTMQFSHRSTDTLAMFPELNSDIVMYIMDIIDNKWNNNVSINSSLEYLDISDPVFQKYIQSENFMKLYSYIIQKKNVAETEIMNNEQGEWLTFSQYSDVHPLVTLLNGCFTGWCIRGIAIAEEHLLHGDIHVYCSYDEKGMPIIPRAIIRVGKDNDNFEVKGILVDQEIEPCLSHIVAMKESEVKKR
jgi:hypothetical protein